MANESAVKGAERYNRIVQELPDMRADAIILVTTLDPAHVDTPDFASAYMVAEFMLNLLTMRHPPKRQDVELYIKTHFVEADGTYRIPVHQDFITIRSRR